MDLMFHRRGCSGCHCQTSISPHAPHSILRSSQQWQLQSLFLLFTPLAHFHGTVSEVFPLLIANKLPMTSKPLAEEVSKLAIFFFLASSFPFSLLPPQREEMLVWGEMPAMLVVCVCVERGMEVKKNEQACTMHSGTKSKKTPHFRSPPPLPCIIHLVQQ